MQETCKELGDDGQPCGRVLFTIKSGLCQRHYDRARTARKAAERPAVIMVRDRQCFICAEKGEQGMGYRTWDGDPPGSVVCKRHWDMWRRRGTFEEAEATVELPTCEFPGGCTNRAPYREFGVLCQNHHRMAKRRGSANFGIELPKGPARYGTTDHRKKDSEQLAADLQARRAERIGKNCGNGHLLGGNNLRVNADGSLTCRACERMAQDRYLASEKGREATERRREQDLRNKRARELRHRFGLTIAQYDALVIQQHNNCAICRKPLTFDFKTVAVDHDRACCAGPQSCGKCVRGVVHTVCNSGLGFFKDDSTAMVYAAIYVLKHRKATAAEYEALAEMLLYE